MFKSHQVSQISKNSHEIPSSKLEIKFHFEKITATYFPTTNNQNIIITIQIGSKTAQSIKKTISSSHSKNLINIDQSTIITTQIYNGIKKQQMEKQVEIQVFLEANLTKHFAGKAKIDFAQQLNKHQQQAKEEFALVKGCMQSGKIQFEMDFKIIDKVENTSQLSLLDLLPENSKSFSTPLKNQNPIQIFQNIIEFQAKRIEELQINLFAKEKGNENLLDSQQQLEIENENLRKNCLFFKNMIHKNLEITENIDNSSFIKEILKKSKDNITIHENLEKSLEKNETIPQREDLNLEKKNLQQTLLQWKDNPKIIIEHSSTESSKIDKELKITDAEIEKTQYLNYFGANSAINKTNMVTDKSSAKSKSAEKLFGDNLEFHFQPRIAESEAINPLIWNPLELQQFEQFFKENFQKFSSKFEEEIEKREEFFNQKLKDIISKVNVYRTNVMTILQASLDQKVTAERLAIENTQMKEIAGKLKNQEYQKRNAEKKQEKMNRLIEDLQFELDAEKKLHCENKGALHDEISTEMNKKIDLLEKEIETQKQYHKQKEGEHSQSMINMISEMNEKIKELEKEKEKEAKTNKILESKNNELMKYSKDLQDKINNSNDKEIDALKIKEMQESNKLLNQTNKNLLERIHEQEKQIAENQIALKAESEEQNRLKKVVYDMKNLVEECKINRKTKEENEQKIATLTKQLNDYEARLKNENAKYQEKMKNLKEKNDKNTIEIEELKGALKNEKFINEQTMVNEKQNFQEKMNEIFALKEALNEERMKRAENENTIKSQYQQQINQINAHQSEEKNSCASQKNQYLNISKENELLKRKLELLSKENEPSGGLEGTFLEKNKQILSMLTEKDELLKKIVIEKRLMEEELKDFKHALAKIINLAFQKGENSFIEEIKKFTSFENNTVKILI